MTWHLETERLRLRPMRLDDLDAFHEVIGDRHSMRFYPWAFTRDMARRWIEQNLERYERDGLGLLAIEERATGEMVGDCGATIQSVDGEPFVELDGTCGGTARAGATRPRPATPAATRLGTSWIPIS